MFAGDEGAEPFEVLREFSPADRLGGSGEMPAGIADGDANRLGADVEAGKLAALANGRGELTGLGGDQRRHAASLLAASRRTAPQNSA